MLQPQIPLNEITCRTHTMQPSPPSTPLQGKEVEEIFDEVDLDTDGKVSFVEFLAYLHRNGTAKERLGLSGAAARSRFAAALWARKFGAAASESQPPYHAALSCATDFLPPERTAYGTHLFTFDTRAGQTIDRDEFCAAFGYGGPPLFAAALGPQPEAAPLLLPSPLPAVETRAGAAEAGGWAARGGLKLWRQARGGWGGRRRRRSTATAARRSSGEAPPSPTGSV